MKASKIVAANQKAAKRQDKKALQQKGPKRKEPKAIVFAAKQRRSLRHRIAPSPWWQEELRSKRLRKMPPPADHTPMQACVSPNPDHKTCGRVYPMNYVVSVLVPSPLPSMELVGHQCEDCRQENIFENRQRIAAMELSESAEVENMLSTGQNSLSGRGECANLVRRQQVISQLRAMGFTDREIAVGSRVLEGRSFRQVADLTGIRKSRVGVVFGSFRARCDRMGVKFEDLRNQPKAEEIITDPAELDRTEAPAD